MVFEEDDVLFAGAMRVATLLALMQYESVYTVWNAGKDPVSMTSLLESFYDDQEEHSGPKEEEEEEDKTQVERIAEAVMAPFVFAEHDADVDPKAYETYLFGLLSRALQEDQDDASKRTKDGVLTDDDIDGLLRAIERQHEDNIHSLSLSFLCFADLVSLVPIDACVARWQPMF